MKQTRILLVEPVAILCKGLGMFIEEHTDLKVVEAVHSFAEVKEKDNEVDLVLFDIESNEDYKDFMAFKGQNPTTKTLFISSEERLVENYLFTQTEAVDLFLSKKMSPELLIQRIREVASGKIDKEITDMSAYLFNKLTA